ncbi:MAG: hypothetical protein HC850_03005 [Rhodomicrobium sp.]|nr:hypothetical protein [Rhodomicrobium sp.]
MVDDVNTGASISSVDAAFERAFNSSSLLVPQLSMIRSLTLISDIMEDDTEGLAKLPMALAQIDLSKQVAAHIVSISDDLAKGGPQAQLALPQLLQAYGINVAELLIAASSSLDQDMAKRTLLPETLQLMGMPQELAKAIGRLVDVVARNNERIAGLQH